MKISIKNIANGNVQIDGEFNGTKISVIDDGTLTNGSGVVQGPPFTGTGKWCFIRTNRPSAEGVKYRNARIKQL